MAYKAGNVSKSFKISVVILLFFLALIRLILVFFLPSSEVISDKVFLSIIVFIVFYLWVQELIDLGNLIKINKHLEETQEELKQAQVEAIASLIKAEEAKDLYTCGHSERVTKIALSIAEAMNISEESKKIISRAGILHDIGKISISDEILHKREKLTDTEWVVIRKHPQDGVKILEPLHFLAAERKVILEHHERYDGKGYPQGLKGKDICLEALVLAVADAFDAMNSKRSYRGTLEKENIISELNKARGTQHSAQVIDAFLALLEKQPHLWEK